MTICLHLLSIPEYKVNQKGARIRLMGEKTCRVATSRVSLEGTWIWAIQEPFRPPNLAPSTTSILAITPGGGLFTVVPWRCRQRKSEKFLQVCPLQSTLLQQVLPTTIGTHQAILPPNQRPALSPAPSSCKMAITAVTLGAPPVE